MKIIIRWFKLFHCEHCMANIHPEIKAAIAKVGAGPLMAVRCPHCGKMTSV